MMATINLTEREAEVLLQLLTAEIVHMSLLPLDATEFAAEKHKENGDLLAAIRDRLDRS